MTTKGDMTDPCPPLGDLHGEDPQTQAHVERCPRCQALLALVADEGPELGDREMPDFPRAALPERAPRAERAIGEIVAIDGEEAAALLLAVVCAWGDAALEVAPIATETRWATEWDLLLDPGDSSLGYCAMVEVWNHGPVLADQVTESLGGLGDPARSQLEALYAAVFTGADPPEARTGPPVRSEADPRVSFQRTEIERARCYWPQPPAEQGETAEVVETKPNLAGRLATWLEREDFDIDDLARDTSWSRGEIRLVLEDRIDPVVAPFFKHESMAELLHAIDVDEDELESMLPATVPAIRFPEPEEAGRAAAFHRGLDQASRLRVAASVEGPGQEPTSGQRAAQLEWVNGVIAAFEETSE